MSHQPDDCDTERDHQNEKNNPAFPPFFPQRDATAPDTAVVTPALVLERDRDVQPAAAFAGALQQFLALPASCFLGDAGSFRDHALDFFDFAPKLRFALSEFFLFLVERRSGFKRSAAHAESPAVRGHPKENQERDHPKNNQRQRHRETDLYPLRERFSASQSRKTRRGLRQIQVG